MGDQPPYTQPHGLASAPALPHPQPLQYPAAVSNGRTATSQLQQQPPSTLATVGMRENYNAHQTGVTSLPPLNQMTHLPPPSQQQQHYHLQEPSRPIIRSNSHGYGSERNFDSDNGHPPTSHLPPPSNFHSQPPPPQNGHDYGYGQQQHYYSQASPNQGYYPPQPPSHHRHQQQYPPHPNSSYQQHHQEQPQPYADQHYGNYSNGGYQESPQYHHPTYSPNYPVQRSPPLPPKQSPMIRSQSLQDQRAFPQLPGPHDYHPQPTHHQVYSQTPQPMQGYQDNILFPPRSPPIPGRQLPAPPHSAYNPGHPLQYQPPLSPPRNATLPPPIPSNYAPNQSYQPPLREFIHAQDRYPAPPQRHEPIQIDRMSGSGGVDTRVGPKKRGRPPKLPAPYAVYAPEPDAKRARGAGGYSVVDLTRVDSVPSVFDSTDSFHDGMYAVDGNIATMGVPATLYGGRKPAIGDDLDPATLAVAHPLHPLPVVGGTALVMIPVVSSTVAGAFDGVASAKEKIGAEEMMKKSGAENMEKLVVKADADEKENIKEKNQDGGSSSGGLAVSEESSNDVVLDKTMLDAQKRRLSLPEALDFLSVVDFLREFGSVLLKLNGMDSLSLGAFEKIIYNVPANYTRFLAIYSAMLVYIYPEARFKTKPIPGDVPAHLAHHFACSMTAATNAGSFLIDARYLCKVFSQISFIEIPPPFHVAALTSLVSSIQAAKAFNMHVNASIEELDVLRKQKMICMHSIRDMKHQVDAMQSEISVLDTTVIEMERSLLALNDPETGKIRFDVGTTTVKNVHDSIKERSMARNAISQKHSQLLKEVKALEEKSADTRKLWETKQRHIRVVQNRVLGMDRNGAQYLWIDIGMSDEQSFLLDPRTPAKSDKNEVDGKEEAGSSSSSSSSQLSKQGSREPESNVPFRVCGIIVDTSTAFHVSKHNDVDSMPTPPANTSSSPEALTIPSQMHYMYIDSIALLKKLGRSLNDRGHRERELMHTLRERFAEYGLALPAPVNQSLRKAWDLLDATPLSKDELVLEKGFGALVTWIQSLGLPIDPTTVPVSTTTVADSRGAGDGGGGSNVDLNSSTESITSTRPSTRSQGRTSATAPAPLRSRARAAALNPPEVRFEKENLKVALGRLNELADMPGSKTFGQDVLSEAERSNIRRIDTLERAVEFASLVIGRKFGAETTAEMDDRMDRCETWSMFNVLIADFMRETKNKMLVPWIEETKDGGWVEEDEFTAEFDDMARGVNVGNKKKLTRRPRKVVKE